MLASLWLSPRPTAHRLRSAALQLCAATLLAGTAAQVSATPASTLVEAVQLPAWIERDGQRQPARPGQLLHANDRAITAERSRMLLRLPDRSLIKLGEKTQLQIDVMEKMRQGHAASPGLLVTGLRLITGVFRYATDYTSKALGYQRELNLKLSTATVGIRGTDFWSMTDDKHDAVCLFEGHVAVARTSLPEIHLEQPGAFWAFFNNQPEKPAGQATPEQLAKFIDQAEMKPGSGIVLQGGRWRTVAALLSSPVKAAELRSALRAAGFPAEIVVKAGRHEVRINQFATREDAQAVLDWLRTQPDLGVDAGRVALAAE